MLCGNLQAQELSLEENGLENPVIIDTVTDISASYKDRRTTHGALFSVNMESFYPLNYRSLYSDLHIENLIQDNKISLYTAELGYKYNISIFSAAILFSYGQGSILGFNGLVDERKISFTKMGASANLAADGVFSEPWVVPYFQGGIHQFQVSERKTVSATDVQDASATTGVSFNYRYGLLFQLDWLDRAIDKSAKTERLLSSGMENVYLDVYFSEYLASADAIDPSSDLSTEGDPNMLSSGELGVGLKIEF